MFGHKSFLKLGALSDASIQGLYKDSYELQKCSYSFSKGINTDGKAQTEVRGGSINISISGIPPTDIIEWALSSKKYYDGAIVICDDNNMPLEKIYFTDAACVSMEITYTQIGKAYITTNLVLKARKMSVGNTELDNHWTGFN